MHIEDPMIMALLLAVRPRVASNHLRGGCCVFVSLGFQFCLRGAIFLTEGRNAVSLPEDREAGCMQPTV